MSNGSETSKEALAARRVELMLKKVSHSSSQVEVVFFLSDENMGFYHVTVLLSFLQKGSKTKFSLFIEEILEPFLSEYPPSTQIACHFFSPR